jgi:hypothetical protein
MFIDAVLQQRKLGWFYILEFLRLINYYSGDQMCQN